IAEFTAETIGAKLAADDERLDEAARRAELALAAEADDLELAAEAELALATEAELAEAKLAEATEAELALATEAKLALATEAELALATEAELALATEAELALATEAELALATEAELALATEAELALATDAKLATEAELALAAEAEFTLVEAATLVVVPQLLKRPMPRTLQTTEFKAFVAVATAAELDEVVVEDRLEDRDELELPTTTVESPELGVELETATGELELLAAAMGDTLETEEVDATRELETDTAAHTP
ncbi:hypothetical protein LTS18_002282, partial [Coniosporium uncinatum]